MDEIKRLQDEFAKAQMSGSMAKLSERNCVEIIQLLQHAGMIDLMYTMDGKQYLTHAQLDREIQDELYVHGGRINVVSLHEIVNVDLIHVEAAVEGLIKADGQMHLVQGDLIDNNYIDGLALEVNDMLLEAGYITISELCKRFDLPNEFLTEHIERRVGTIIQGQMESGTGAIFTKAFVSRQAARVRGVFGAITRPTSLSALMGKYPFHQKLFRSELDRLIAESKLAGKVQGRADKAMYIPDIQQKTQDKWIASFYRENGYIEYDTVERLGVKNPKSKLKSLLGGTATALETCVVSTDTVNNVESAVGQAIIDGQFVDIQELLPSPCTPQDAEALIQKLESYKKSKAVRIICESIVCSDTYISAAAGLFQESMKLKATEYARANKSAAAAATAGTSANASSVQENTATSGDSGKSRKEKRNERKEKRAKNKSGGRGAESSGSNSTATGSDGKDQQFTFMSVKEIETVLQDNLKDGEANMYAELAGLLHRQLTARFQDFVREAFLGGASGAGRKELAAKLADEYAKTYIHARLCEPGIALFEANSGSNLVKYLLKDLGARLLGVLCRLAAQHAFIECSEKDELSAAQRKEVYKQLPKSQQDRFVGIEDLLSGKDVGGFLDALEDVAEEFGQRVKRTDKKRDRQLVFAHRHELQEQLRGESDPPTVLLIAAALLFQRETGYPMHAQGRAVPQVVAFLKDKLGEPEHATLEKYQEKVMAKLKSKGDEDDVDPVLPEDTDALKELALRK